MAHALYSGSPVLRDIGFADHRFVPPIYADQHYRSRQLEIATYNAP
jgi:hypothetical protein